MSSYEASAPNISETRERVLSGIDSSERRVAFAWSSILTFLRLSPIDNLRTIRKGIEGSVVGGSIVTRQSVLIWLSDECQELENLGVVSIDREDVILKMNPSEALDIVDDYIRMESL